MGTPPDRRLSREWLAEISWTILFVVAALSAALGYGIGASNTNAVEYVPGPVRIEYVDVPGPARVEYVDVPGPERIVEQFYEVDSDCAGSRSDRRQKHLRLPEAAAVPGGVVDSGRPESI